MVYRHGSRIFSRLQEAQGDVSTCGGREEMSEIKVFKDEIAERLDELSDIGEYWKKHRERGRMPTAVRAAMISLCGEIKVLAEI